MINKAKRDEAIRLPAAISSHCGNFQGFQPFVTMIHARPYQGFQATPLVLAFNSEPEYDARKRRLRRNREGIETVVDILNAASDGVRKSHIMLKANLNSVKAGQLIQQLISSGLLRAELYNGQGPLYQTTERGLNLVNLFREIETLLIGREREIEA